MRLLPHLACWRRVPSGMGDGIKPRADSATGAPPTMVWTGEALALLDQRLVPERVEYLSLRDHSSIAMAIRDMAVRGAPAIGCAAAFGLALAVRSAANQSDVDWGRAIDRASAELLSARPTAVNLRWAIERVRRVCETEGREAATAAALREAERMLAEDREINRRIGDHGANLLPDPCTILTHCNAGALATAGYGTALGVIRSLHRAGKLYRVYVDETRPRLQGARLTAWELLQENIQVTILPDGAAAWLMKNRRVDCVVVGADRIAANGDTANKVGTYGLAITAQAHDVPLYVAAPISTFDWRTPTGSEIPIEERDPDEVTHVMGARIAPDGVSVWNPSFDVTPKRLITAFITEHGVYEPTAEDLLRLRGISEER